MKRLIYRLFVQFKLQFVAYVFSFQSKNEPTNKFVIFSQGRTGSTLLVDLLNSHPQINCEDEIFNRQRHLFGRKIIWPYRFLKGMAVLRKQQVFGFKVKIYQLTKHQKMTPKDFLDHLEKQHYKIIYLRRNNFLEHALSGLTAKQTKQYHLFEGDADQTQQFEFSATELERKMQRRSALQKQELALLDGRKYFEVVYDQDLKIQDQHQAICERIFTFLGLEKVKVNTNLKKVIRKKPAEQLSNFVQLQNYFSNTNFASFFQEDEIALDSETPFDHPSKQL